MELPALADGWLHGGGPGPASTLRLGVTLRLCPTPACLLEPRVSESALAFASRAGRAQVDDDGGIPTSVDFDAEELEDAKWFDKAFVAERLKAQGDSDEPPVAGDFHVPSRISLARTLFEAWLAEE